jgi:signal transduction histidine kinase
VTSPIGWRPESFAENSINSGKRRRVGPANFAGINGGNFQSLAPDTIMTGGNIQRSDDAHELIELGHLAAAIGHNVINAFSAIVSNAELLRSRSIDTSDPSELDNLASGIVETSLDASQIARKLIDWSRRTTAVEVDSPGHQSPDVDLNQLLSQMVDVEKALAPPQVSWAVDLGSIPPIPGLAAHLRTMFGHLLRNAWESLPRGPGSVAVSTYIDPRDWLVVAIRDSGSGMSGDVLRRATEPFFTTKPDRTGIGLTVAQGIWRRHRGALSIDSRQGQGTTIRLSIGPLPKTGPANPGASGAS